MPNADAPGNSDYLSPDEMQKWLAQETADSAKAHELRIKGATDLVTAYASGELTPAQANERLLAHEQRWGEALAGTHAFTGASDEQILASIDKARSEQAEGFGQRFGSRERGTSQRRGQRS